MIDAADIDRLLGIVQLLKDPAAFERELTTLKAEQAGHAQALQEKQAAVDHAAEILATAETARAEARRIASENVFWKAQLDAREKDILSRTAAINERQAALEQAEAEIKQRDAALGERANGLDHMDANLAAREADAAKKLIDAAALMAQYDADKHAAAVKLAGD